MSVPRAASATIVPNGLTRFWNGMECSFTMAIPCYNMCAGFRIGYEESMLEMSETITLPQLPLSFHWEVPPQDWHVSADSGLTISAGARTDLFIDPQGTAVALNAPRLLGMAS